jgi:hypothetical protein
MKEKWENPDNTAVEPPDPPPPPKGGFFSTAKTDIERVMDAIEAWYAGHFRRAALAGHAPLSAADKAELTKAITAAITPSEQ